MSGDGVRRILPQSSQMQSFAFAPQNFGQRENQKNYVFVDEHNRHKRLKVMRACEGCRRRKIKCDAATTNTWPCSACIRLKLHCVPPTVNYDSSSGGGFDGERIEYEGGSGDEDYHTQMPIQQHLVSAQKIPQQIYAEQLSYQDDVNTYHPSSYAAVQSAQQMMQYNNMQGAQSLDNHYQPQSSYPIPPTQQPHLLQTPLQQHLQQPQSLQNRNTSHSPDVYQQDQYAQQDLADYLGVLKMDANGSAPYLSKKKSSQLMEEPAFEEPDNYKDILPLVTSGPDLKIRIPPELMPEEDTALHFFDIYFENVHPYVPVLNKSAFYHQWHNDRETISPLILEAIFAIAGRLADEPSQGQQWLALAGKHADAFMDVPRLSTLQGLLILLKARESAPKRGYYYRSWMTVVQCVTMAKDLGLDEHCDDHKSGQICNLNQAECMTRTRIWQTLFVAELMIGSPQGRRDLAVDMKTLDLRTPQPIQGETAEYHVSRQFIWFTKTVMNVRDLNNVYSKIGKRKDWAIDPQTQSLNSSFEKWLVELPSDLQISFPADGSPPWLPTHFIGNLHTYYHLSIIMLHRPQLNLMDSAGPDGKWKEHMLICYTHAKYLCRLQEAIHQSFGLPGLLCMQRGINFTIYCVLTCTVLHLVALTSPDPDLNSDAREYFTRHMRILEKCSSSWPMPDMQQQIDALREAFSADMRKPFVLKPSFPYGSPAPTNNSSPPRGLQYAQPQMHPSSMEQQSQVSYINHPITPPISAGDLDTKSDSPAVQSLVMMATGQRIAPPHTMAGGIPMVDPTAWNPSRIFDQWNTTFGTPPPPTTQTSSAPKTSPLRLPASGPPPMESIADLQPLPVSSLPISQMSQSLRTQPFSANMPTFVSPSMWQESVASVYEGGLKRQWDYDGHGGAELSAKRSR